jgi:hypothetical protein
LHDLVLGGEERRAALGLGTYISKSVEPKLARTAWRLRERVICAGYVWQ